MLRKLEILLDEQVRPALATHGGDVEIVDIDNNQVFLRLQGGCQGCSSSSATLKDGIQVLIMQSFPEITAVIDVTEHEAGTTPYM